MPSGTVAAFEAMSWPPVPPSPPRPMFSFLHPMSRSRESESEAVRMATSRLALDAEQFVHGLLIRVRKRILLELVRGDPAVVLHAPRLQGAALVERGAVQHERDL